MPSSRRTPRRHKRLHFKSPMCGGRERPPYGTRKMPRPTGKPRSRRTANPCRGRCLHRPADPASPQGPGRDALIPPHARGGANVSILNRQCAAGVNARPTEPGKCGGQPGNCGPALQQTSVGDDARIVPGTPRRRKVPREGHGPPLQTFRNAPPNRNGRDHPGDRRAGCPHPAGPHGGANVCGRIWNPPLRSMVRRSSDQPGNREPCRTENPCRGRCLHRPGTPRGTGSSPGGINPAPTNLPNTTRQTGRPQPPRRP